MQPDQVGEPSPTDQLPEDRSMRFHLVITVVVVSVSPTAADRGGHKREPDPATLIQGDWVIAEVEREGIVTPQFDSPAERRLARVWRLFHHPHDRDKAVDAPDPRPAIPRDTLVYRFDGGRFTVFEEFERVGWGRYRLHGAAHPPALELT